MTGSPGFSAPCQVWDSFCNASGCVAGGGDGYRMIRGLRCLINPEEGPVDPATIINILAADGEIAPRTDGRI